jgi:hypothetical protein
MSRYRTEQAAENVTRFGYSDEGAGLKSGGYKGTGFC